MVGVVLLITVMVKRYALKIVLPAEHVDGVATALEVGARIVTVEPTGQVDFKAAAVTVTVEGWIEAADWVSVTILPHAAGQVDEPATVTVVVRALATPSCNSVPNLVTLQLISGSLIKKCSFISNRFSPLG